MTVLSRLVVLTDRVATARCGRSLPETVREAVDGGARAVLLREKDLPVDQRRALLDACRDLLDPVGGRVGVASDASLAAVAGINWVHLAQADEFQVLGAADGAPGTLIGRSCHNRVEATQAVDEGCAYVTVSPVAITRSKPGYGPAIGAARLREICAAIASTPVWALGGVARANAAGWITAGAHGIFVMGGIMAAPDPAAATAVYLQAIGDAR
jgi:thiamine-phosphate pyrophosphorylase